MGIRKAEAEAAAEMRNGVKIDVLTRSGGRTGGSIPLSPTGGDLGGGGYVYGCPLSLFPA